MNAGLPGRLAAMLCLLGASWPLHAEEPVRIGVLANRRAALEQAAWTPLAASLQRSIPERDFVIEALDASALEAAVATRRVDFVLTHASHYILMARRSGLSAPLATLVKSHRGQPLRAFGGAVIVRAERADLAELKDLRGATVAAANTGSLVGYLAQARELAAIGMVQPRDYRLIETGFLHEKVVEAVLAGRADAGFLLGGVMESLAEKGGLDLARLKVLNRQSLPGYPFAVSTPLTPGQPFAALPHIQDDLSRKVVAALLAITDSGVASALNIHGFTVPANYDGVAALMRELRAPPFDLAPAFTWHDVWSRYRAWLAGMVALAALLLLLSVRLLLAQRRAQAQAVVLAGERRRLGDIIEATQTATWEWNVQSGELRLNERWAEIVGYRLEELTPLSIETWARFTHPEDHRHALGLLERHFAGEADRYECEERKRHKDGHWVWVAVSGRLVSRTPDGQPLLMSGMHQDITERKLAEEALRRNEERLRLVMEATADGIWDYDQDTWQTFFSDHYVALLGYASIEALRQGFRIDRALHAEDRDRVLAAQKRSIEQGAVFDETFQLQRADGQYRWFHGRGMTVRNEQGNIRRFIGALTDIDRAKRAELEILEFNRTLEQRVRQRTAELETALRELEEFSYAASHDLRSPLRAIAGFAQILGEEYAARLDEAAQGYLGRIRGASQHLSETIDGMHDLMRFARAELRPREVDLSALARGILEQFQAREPRTVAIRVADGLLARADPELAAVFLRGLLHNAWKFTGRTPGARIEFGATGMDGERAFFVADNGAGFDPAHAKRLFKPFFKLHAPGEFPGVGIGTAIVRRIVQRHGGRIWATAAPGQGATFFFTLPAETPGFKVSE